MFARVTTVQGAANRVDEGIKSFRDTTLPAAQKLRGFKGSYLMVDRKSGKVVAFTLWDTEANLQASAAAASRLRADAVITATATQPPTVEVYEVAVQP